MKIMSSLCQSSVPVFRTVTIPFSDVKDKQFDLSMKIEEGFGPSGLGILSITNVPGYPSLRKKLLNLAPRLANLPEETRNELEDPSSRFNFGWSHGKEKLESGKPDFLKGSFYANPVTDVPTNEVSLRERYPSYCGSNIWPRLALPALEASFKALGHLVHDVGLMLALHCDHYVSKGTKLDDELDLQKILLRSRCHKGRLLYYFPSRERISAQDDNSTSSWCGWHTDHGLLTGLTCAMFKNDGTEVPCPDSAAGLYIKTRSNQIVKVEFGEDEIAYQVGEICEIMSRGVLCATPHCVRAPQGTAAAGVDRSTFALFMQPNWDEPIHFSNEGHFHGELTLGNCCYTFGEYTEKLLDKYYHTKS